MKNHGALLVALGLILLGQGQQSALAARKYYPPGFVPPSDQKLVPSTAPVETPAPQVIIQQLPGTKQVIIKTVPVTVEKTVTHPAKPRDPLLMLLDEHRYYDAMRLVDARLKKSPNNVSLQMLRGSILRDEASYQLSLDQFQSVLSKARSRSVRAGALNGLGWTYYRKAIKDRQLGDLPGFAASLSSAESAFRQAAQFAPTQPYAWAGLGEVALAHGRTSEAGKYIQKAKRFGPKVLCVQLAEAELLLATHKPDEALQLLYGIKKTTTHDPDVFLLLAKASMATGKVDDAIINLKQLLALVPDHAEALKLLSQSYELKMKPEDAAEILEKAIALNPSDVDSVEALVKIYDQRGQQARSTLLLKTLIKDKPDQAAYGKALMQRLVAQGQWQDAYDEGLAIVEPVLKNPGANENDQVAIVSLFSQSVYQQGRGLLDRSALMDNPVIKQARLFSRVRLQKAVAAKEVENGYDLTDRLNLLLTDPLTSVPALPIRFKPPAGQMSEALQITFLQGDPILKNQLLAQAKSRPDALDLAKDLYNLGDYNGANALASQVASSQLPDATAAGRLEKVIEADRADMDDQLASLAMLPRKISGTYWQKAATDALRLGSGNWETHALLAKGLEKRNELALALVHQRLAAHYVSDPKQKRYWMKKADKTAKALGVPCPSAK